MSDDGVVDFGAARDATKVKRQVFEARRRSADPFEALIDTTGALARNTHGLAVNLAAVEGQVTANAATVAKLTAAIETLTRIVAAALGDVLSRLPPAQGGGQ